MLDTLHRAARGVRRELVTPCCGLAPFLRDYLLWCPGTPGDPCPKTYARLEELVVEEKGNADGR